MKRYLRFNWMVFAITIMGSAAVGLVNAAIDPYGVIGTPKIQRLNDLKPRQFSNVRLFKAANIIRLKPKAILLGSSRTDLGLDPTHPAFSRVQPAYNLGLVGPNMYEVRRYFEHALANQPNLKQVVIGIDFFMFNKYKTNSPDFVDGRLGKHFYKPKDLLATTLSFGALTASLETIEASFQSDAFYLYAPHGMRYVYGGKVREPMTVRFEQSLSEYLNSAEYYKKFQLSQAYLADLRTLVEICKQRNIDLKVFISPSHATQFEAIRVAGHWSKFEDWKREVVKITPVWDFSGYNTITTEPIHDGMRHYWDNSHYTKEVGDLVLNRMLGYGKEKVPNDFGVLLTPETIESHLNQIIANRKVWLSESPQTIAFIETLALKAPQSAPAQTQ
ncbi:MAG: hypothetical protein K6T90_14445 [Leptolyngbyaceae cyanobacterium HOT.MB2.61]|nr:hypothetical protein [Leptolyngbyaceae cyanobacterium HOT.MB2.61]